MQVNYPKSLWILSFGNAWDTFSYFGTQTILVLYLMHVFHFIRSESYLSYGAYSAFEFSMPIVGGIIADRWLGSKRTLIVGSILSIIGNLMLMFYHRYIFCLGLATLITGSGLYKSNSTHLVGTLYKDSDFKKESGFIGFYLAINIGGTLGPLVYGCVAYFISWNMGFLCSAFGILMSLLWFLKNRQLWENKKSQTSAVSNRQHSVIYVVLLLICFLNSLPFYIPFIINPMICLICIVSLCYLVAAIMRHKGKERRHLWALLVLSFFWMFYFIAGLQIGTTVTLFIQHKINQGVIHTALPASTFSMLYSLFVLILTPFIIYLWRWLRTKNKTINVPTKLVIGLTLAMFSMLAFAFATWTNQIIIGILLGNLMLSAGELVLTPAIYTAVSDLSPSGMKSTMMGGCLLFVGFGSYLSSLLANASHQVTIMLFPHGPIYLGEFIFIAAFSAIIVIVAMLSMPKLLSMMK